MYSNVVYGTIPERFSVEGKPGNFLNEEQHAMRQMVIRRAVGLIALVVLVTPLTQVSAGQAKRGIAGDWQIKVDYDGQQLVFRREA